MTSWSNLRRSIDEHLNDEELELLCFDLRVFPGHLEGKIKPRRIASLIELLHRHDRLSELIDWLREERPKVNWPDFADLLEPLELIDPLGWFERLKILMPELIAEMKKDVRDYPFIREFILMQKSRIYTSGSENIVVYYFDDHDDLLGKIHILENYGFVVDVTSTNVKRYRMLEHFVELLESNESKSEPQT